MSDSSYGNLYQGFKEVQGTNSATTTADTALIAAPAPGYQICISKVSISNNSATDSEVVLKSGGVVIWTFSAPKQGGNEPVFPHPIHAADNLPLNFACTVGVTTITVSAAGFIRKTPLNA